LGIGAGFASKIVDEYQRKPQNPREKEFFTLLSFYVMLMK